MDERIADRLRAWRAAGLIDTATVASIQRFERSDPAGGGGAPVADGDRLAVSDILAYLGFSIVLAGILYALFTGIGGSAAGPSILGLAAVATALVPVFLRGATPAGGRAAGAAMATAVGLAALGLGQVLVASGALATTTVLPYNDPSGQHIVVVERNLAAVAAIAAGAAVLLGVAALEAAPTALLALIVGAAAYVSAMTATEAIGGQPWQRLGIAPLAAAAALLALSSGSRLAAVAGPLRFSAALVPAPALLIIGAQDGAQPWPLIGVAGLLTAVVLRFALAGRSNALAVAGVIAAFGTAVDVTARALGSSGGAPAVLIVSGLLLVGCAALTQRVIRRNRSRGADPVGL